MYKLCLINGQESNENGRRINSKEEKKARGQDEEEQATSVFDV